MIVSVEEQCGDVDVDACDAVCSGWVIRGGGGACNCGGGGKTRGWSEGMVCGGGGCIAVTRGWEESVVVCGVTRGWSEGVVSGGGWA